MSSTFTAIRFSGLNTDCLGNYLAALGLLAITSHKWPGIRGCWVDGDFVFLSADTITAEAIEAFLLQEWKPRDYDLWWTDSQKKDTKAKSSSLIWRERNSRPVADIALLDAHIVPTGRNVFNPVLGTGGNVGKRNLAKAFSDAKKLLSKGGAQEWLQATLTGQCNVALPKLNNGGTWFVYANKTYNSGRKWFQEGLISPWSILFATEGALLLSGGINRRLSARSRPYAVFPFISEPVAPESSGDIAATTADFWAPIWCNPATLIELQSILRRGLARFGNRTARGSHEFAVAAMSAGVDAGIEGFARFELRQTTSSQVYEAIPKPRILVSETDSCSAHASVLLMEVIESGWLDRLPFEPHDSKQRGKFVGLRGPVEVAIVKIAERAGYPQGWRDLLLLLSRSQARIDRNHNLRKTCLPLSSLSADWFRRAWPESCPAEVLIGKSVASLGSRGSSQPLAKNVFGVEGRFKQKSKLWFPKARPASAIWNDGDPLQTLLVAADRRLVDADDTKPSPFAGTQRCPFGAIQLFLTDDVDLNLVAKWIPPLSLIDWSSVPSETWERSDTESCGTALVHGFVRPLFHGTYADRLTVSGRKLFDNPNRKPKPTFLRRLFNLLRFNEIDRAIELARGRYQANQVSVIEPPSMEADGERIAAALLVPMYSCDVANGFARWLQPCRSFSN